ncbi:MAG: ferrous iron transport protein A [Oscillospiraceae bacterium]|jgi:Fe2+ transport system protein FeoA|nr:ferrous iron transport protein A [Oscillospiraceae bacterium]
MIKVIRMNLSELKMNKRAMVVDVVGERSIKCRMMEFGFVFGAELEVVKAAPLGDPIQVKLGENDFIIRKDDAKNIIVE